MTFSIVAYDPVAREWGVATASKFLAVGAVVPWAQANAGAIATQSYANTSYGPDGLALLAQGLDAAAVLDRLLAEDAGRDQRQVGVVDRQGRAATFTGAGCHAWAGGLTGEGYAVQGNILVSGKTIEATAQGFERARGELADRLVAALAAGQRAGGDRRGRQSAAVLVVRERGGYAGFNDRYLDLRVDDNPQPIARLKELLELHHLFFGKVSAAALKPLTPAVVRDLQRIARQSRHYRGAITGRYDEATRRAVEELIGVENLEDRWPFGTNQYDPVSLRHLKKRFPAASPRGAGQAAPLRSTK